MTILKKLTDRDSFIYEVIKIIIVNNKGIQMPALQMKLLECGVYVKKPLLQEALETMLKTGQLNPVKQVAKVEKPKIITQL